jgi:hypothetical protein
MQTMVNSVLVTDFKLFAITFFMLFFFSCKKENMGDCLKGTGTIITESRTVNGPFQTIEIEQNVSLVLTQSADYFIKVEAGKNLIDLIETEIKNNTLTIRNKNKCNWMRSYDKPVTVYVTLPDLISLQYRSSGDVTSANRFQLDSLNLEVWGGAGTVKMNVDCRVAVYAIHTGTGDLYLSGKTGVSYVWNSGNGFFHGKGLETDYTFIAHQGTGNCYVYPKIHLGATILHIGNIYYKGEPEIFFDIRGTGKLIKLD